MRDKLNYKYDELKAINKIIKAYITTNNRKLYEEAFMKCFRESNLRNKIRFVAKRVLSKLNICEKDYFYEYYSSNELLFAVEDLMITYDIECGKKSRPSDKFDYIVDNQNEDNELIWSFDNGYVAMLVDHLDVGGVETVIKNLVLGFKNRGMQVRVFCAFDGGRTAEYLKNEKIDVISFNGNKRKFDKYIKHNKPAIVLSHYVSCFYDVVKKNDIAIIEVIHNTYLFLDKKRKKLEREKSNYVDGYVAVSSIAKNYFESNISCSKPIVVIGNYSPINENVLEDRDEYNNDYVFLVVASIDSRKNQFGILRALKIIRPLVSKKIKIIFAGNVMDNKYYEKIQNYIAKNDLGENVVFAGYREDVAHLMNNADAMILYSYFEGWSVAATEGVESGLPIIHSNCGSANELIDGGNGIIIDNPLVNIEKYSSKELLSKMKAGINENIAQLAVAMIEMINDSYEWNLKREYIRKDARKRFDYNIMIDKYIRLMSGYIHE